ncbi:primase-helicase family protein [Mucilaginibacter sp. CSA2-8R]|uniref:primase-helicase family protein n=1 Tax=Mucilaginibacter sp. CSA2-8R TaxID=3141542 RepID=UPI00315D5389
MAPRQHKTTTEIDPENLDTYFKKRMHEIGIKNTADYYFKVDGEHPQPSRRQPIFAKKEYGDIQINYPCLYGGFEAIGNTEEPFWRIRINPENQREADYKYFQPANSGIHIFHPPAIIQKFNKKQTIQTLYIVEGEFKAFAGSLAGLDIVGLGGKDLFKDPDGGLHADIQAIIKACEVENLVLLLDADVFELNWNYEDEPNKDLSKRLYSFYGSVKNFRELTKGKVKDIYFSHIKDTWLKEAKGLDDLLLHMRGQEEKITTDLGKLTAARTYFHTINLSTESINKVKGYFRLTMHQGIPAAFYAYNEGIIGDREFTFLGARFVRDKEKGLHLVAHQDSFKFIRVACDYFKEIQVPNSKGVLEKRRIPWSKGEITMDYVKKGVDNFFDSIPKYDTFCNVPCNTSDYQQIINDCYNLYYKLDHEPEEGKWPSIKKYLTHVFGENPIGDGKTTSLDLAMDCIQLKYLKPTQKLPILCLVSKERNTGKSTFLWLMREIFEENSTVIGNQEINDMYNDDWASKAVVGIDEGFIDKKIVLEKIKSQSTNDKIKLRGMYAGRQDVSFFGWFILTSNDETNFMAIDEEEIRFWVVKVNPYTEEDPFLLRKMTEEIPYFLHYLQQRELVHEQSSRFWFKKELLETDALRKIKEKSRGWFIGELQKVMEELFFHYRYHTLYYTLTELFEILNGGNAGTKFRKADISDQLQEKLKLEPRLARHQHPNDPSKGLSLTSEKHGRCYEFRIEDFVSEAKIRNELSDYINFDDLKDIRKRPSSEKTTLEF